MITLPPLPPEVMPVRAGTCRWTRQTLEDMAPESLVDMLRRVMDATNMKPMAQRTWLKMLRAVLVEQTATVNGWRASGRTFTLDAIAAGKGRLQMPPHPLAQENPTYFRCTFLGTPKSIAVHLTGGPDALEAAGQVARQYGLQAVLGGVPAWHDPGKALPVLYRPCPWDGKPGLNIPKLRGAT